METCPNCDEKRLECVGRLEGDDLWVCQECGVPHRGELPKQYGGLMPDWPYLDWSYFCDVKDSKKDP